MAEKKVEGIVPVQIGQFETRLQTSYHQLEAMFEYLKETGQKNARKEALKPENRQKNRFQDVVPFDSNRVKLISDDSDSHYINASFIYDKHKDIKHIATQAPLKTGLVDFYKMLMDQMAEAVVMLTKTQEGGAEQCPVYWPEDYNSLRFGHMEVQLVMTTTYPNHIERKLSLKQGRRERSIVHYQFLSWPENGVPSDPTAFLDFVEKVKADTRYSTCPLVVHCSDGAGRTGVFMALHQLLDDAKNKLCVDVPDSLFQLRFQRPLMIQDVDQFRFIYTTLLMYIKRNPELLLERKNSRRNSRKRKSKDGADSSQSPRSAGEADVFTKHKRIRLDATEHFWREIKEAREQLKLKSSDFRTDMMNELFASKKFINNDYFGKVPKSEVELLKKVFNQEYFKGVKLQKEQWEAWFAFERLALRALQHRIRSLIRQNGTGDTLQEPQQPTIKKVIRKLKKPGYFDLKVSAQGLIKGLNQASAIAEGLRIGPAMHGIVGKVRKFYNSHFCRPVSLSSSMQKEMNEVLEEQAQQKEQLEREQTEEKQVQDQLAKKVDKERLSHLTSMG